MNKKGYVPLQVILILGLMAGITGKAVQETSENGVLKNNGKKIWCKMLNKGEDYCNETYKLGE